MTTTLKISDGTTEIDFMNFNPGVTRFTPGVSVGATGSEDEDITETITVYSQGDNIEEVYNDIRVVETLLAKAEEYQKTKAAKKVYLVFSPTGVAQYRAEILRGKVTYPEDQLRIFQAAGVVEFTMMFNRRYFFELNSEYQIPLINGSIGAKTTNAVTIYNHDDAGSGHDDWVEANSVDVDGTMPSPLRIELSNTTASQRDSIIYMGIATFGEPANFPHILEGEDNSGSSDQVDADSSGGNFGRFTTTTSFALKGVWALSAANAQALSGRYYRIIGRFKTLPSATSYCYFSTHITGGTTEQTTSQIVTLSTANYLQELGVMRLPPWMTSEADIQTFDLGLNLKSSASSDVDLDFIALIPTDGFKAISFIDSGPQNTDSIIIDDINNLYYTQTSGGKKIGNVSVYGDKLMIWPDITQRLFFLFQNDAPAMDIARTHGVKVYHRPRRATL